MTKRGSLRGKAMHSRGYAVPTQRVQPMAPVPMYKYPVTYVQPAPIAIRPVSQSAPYGLQTTHQPVRVLSVAGSALPRASPQLAPVIQTLLAPPAVSGFHPILSRNRSLVVLHPLMSPRGVQPVLRNGPTLLSAVPYATPLSAGQTVYSRKSCPGSTDAAPTPTLPKATAAATVAWNNLQLPTSSAPAQDAPVADISVPEPLQEDVPSVVVPEPDPLESDVQALLAQYQQVNAPCTYEQAREQVVERRKSAELLSRFEGLEPRRMRSCEAVMISTISTEVPREQEPAEIASVHHTLDSIAEDEEAKAHEEDMTPPASFSEVTNSNSVAEPSCRSSSTLQGGDKVRLCGFPTNPLYEGKVGTVDYVDHDGYVQLALPHIPNKLKLSPNHLLLLDGTPLKGPG